MTEDLKEKVVFLIEKHVEISWYQLEQRICTGGLLGEVLIDLVQEGEIVEADTPSGFPQRYRIKK